MGFDSIRSWVFVALSERSKADGSMVGRLKELSVIDKVS